MNVKDTPGHAPNPAVRPSAKPDGGSGKQIKQMPQEHKTTGAAPSQAQKSDKSAVQNATPITGKKP